jgi:hypothetical protein
MGVAWVIAAHCEKPVRQALLSAPTMMTIAANPN